MNSGIAREWEYFFADGSATAAAVARMITRVFSSYLDLQIAWYALNDKLCGVPPRKFCVNNIFALFPEEVRRVNICDLRDENGGEVSMSCFNRGAKGTDALYAGTAFAVLAGNLRRKDPGEEEFLKSTLFERLRKAVNIGELLAFADTGESSSSTQCNSLEMSSDRSDDLILNSDRDSSLISSCAEEDVRGHANSNRSPESPPNSVESPPKCSTPNCSSSSFTVSSPSSSSSPDGSISSLADIEGFCLAPATKKRKIRKKVETVMGDITNLCVDNGETLSEMIAQCCLFQRKDNFDGKNIVRNIFERVEKERGVRKTCEELIPEDLWRKRVDEMCVPDWIILLCKLESRISDDGWQTILSRSRLGKSGVSIILLPWFFILFCYFLSTNFCAFKP